QPGLQPPCGQPPGTWRHTKGVSQAGASERANSRTAEATGSPRHETSIRPSRSRPMTTLASLLVSGGMSLPLIGGLSGHTQVQPTHRYTLLFDDPLRAGLHQVDHLLRPKLKPVEISPPAPRPSVPESERLEQIVGRSDTEQRVRLPALPNSEAEIRN